MASVSCRASSEPVRVRHLGTVEYSATWDRQRELAEARAAGTGPDTFLLLEHEAVYTAGKRTEPADLPVGSTIPVLNVDRGGKLTWHGPGQLVGYPIIGLAEPIDVVHYVRRLEQALIAVCDQLGVATGRVEGRSGVWLPAADGRPERKIAAIGIRVQRGVTMHGFSINCDNDLAPFENGVACGIRDAGVTSLTAELGHDIPVAAVLPLAESAVLSAVDGTLPVTDRNLARETSSDAPTANGITFALSS